MAQPELFTPSEQQMFPSSLFVNAQLANLIKSNRTNQQPSLKELILPHLFAEGGMPLGRQQYDGKKTIIETQEGNLTLRATRVDQITIGLEVFSPYGRVYHQHGKTVEHYLPGPWLEELKQLETL
jgi:hypothetical protein